MATKKSDQEMRALILIMTDRTKKRIEIPVGAKVTYGPALPMKMGKYEMPADRSGALRIYRTQTDVIAMFRDVAEFWEEGLRITKQVRNIKKNSSLDQNEGKNGTSTVATSAETETFATVDESFNGETTEYEHLF